MVFPFFFPRQSHFRLLFMELRLFPLSSLTFLVSRASSQCSASSSSSSFFLPLVNLLSPSIREASLNFLPSSSPPFTRPNHLSSANSFSPLIYEEFQRFSLPLMLTTRSNESSSLFPLHEFTLASLLSMISLHLFFLFLIFFHGSSREFSTTSATSRFSHHFSFSQFFTTNLLSFSSSLRGFDLFSILSFPPPLPFFLFSTSLSPSVHETLTLSLSLSS